MTNAVDGRDFHVRVLDKTATYAKIEKLMAQFEPKNAEELQKPILKGTLCAAKYKVDQKWYRARVLQSLGHGKIQVEFIDYGNQAEVETQSLKKLPANLLQFEPQAKRCQLAYVKVPRLDRELGDKAMKYVKKHGLDKVLDAIVIDERSDLLKVILVEEGETDWSESINAFLLAEGLAILDTEAIRDEKTPEEIDSWQQYED